MEISVYASGSSGNAYKADFGEDGRLLLECGIPFRQLQKASGFTLTQFDACLISHEHGDHAKAARRLIDETGMRILCSEGTAKVLGIDDDVHCVRLKADREIRVKGLRILPLAVEHDAAEPMAFYIWNERGGERLFYGTDLEYMPYNLRGLTHLMIEANYADGYMDAGQAALNTRIMHSHMSIDALEEWLRRGDAKRTLREIWLLHLSSDRSNEMEFKRRIQALTGCEVYVA